jgi:arginyl-tRNA synthetase
MNLIALLQQRFHDALTGLVNDPDKLAEYASLIKPSNKGGDYQSNCAMPLGKKVLGRNPREVAEEVVKRLKIDDILEPPEVAGPGFINLTLKTAWLAKQMQAMAIDARLGVAPASKAKKYVIDYSSPNVAKPLHVGHLRSTIIGDSLMRILKFLGHSVISDNHLGDWGTQFGMLLYGYKNFLDLAALETDPIAELVRLYLYVRGLTKGREDDEGDVQRLPEEAAHYAKCLEETAKLQAGDPENLAIWQQFVNWTMDTVEPLYKLLEVSFDYYHGESFYRSMLPGVVESLLQSGIASESQGAIVIFLKPKPEEGEEYRADAVVRKRDGAFTYMTSDLACIRYRDKEWHPDSLLYVVGMPQAQHFATLFESARRWGYKNIELTHVAFGSMLGNDGKTLSTRNGGAADLSELLRMAVVHGQEKYEQLRKEKIERGEEATELSEVERQQIAQRVGIGAVKYADLSQNRTTDYEFNWDKMLSTTGNSATYMQYAYTRCQGIFRKGNVDLAVLRTSPPAPSLAEPQERDLALQLARFEETIQTAAMKYEPHHLTAYLWDLAKAFSRFNDACSVLKAETPELRQGRLVLCDLTARTISQTLGLLGIGTMDRM